MTEKGRFFSNGGETALILAAIALLTVARAAPALTAFFISFQDYRPETGLLGSPWVGLNFYRSVFGSMFFQRSLRNSLLFGLLGGILPVLPGYFVGRLAGKCPPKTSWVYTGALLLPVFLPVDFFARLLLQKYGSQQDASMVFPIFLVTAGLRAMFFTAFLSASLGRLLTERGGTAAKGARLGAGFSLALGLIFLLSPDEAVCYTMMTPFNQDYTNILSLLRFRKGIADIKYSVTAAAWGVRMLLQLPGWAAGTALILRVFKELAPHKNDAPPPTPQGKPIFAPLCAAVTGILFLSLAGWLLLRYPGWEIKQRAAILNASVVLLALTLFFAVLYLPAVGWISGRGQRVVLIICCVLLPLAGNTYGELIVYGNLHMTGTPVAYALSSVSIPLALALGLFSRAEKADRPSFSVWFIRARPILLLFLGLIAAQSWGSRGTQAYFSNVRTQPLLAMELFSFYSPEKQIQASAVLLWLGLPVVLLAVLAVLIFGRLMDRRQG